MLHQDEASLANTATVSYAWAETGTQPRTAQKQRGKERRTLYGAANIHTGVVTADVAARGNTLTFFKFLMKAVRQYKGRKVYMVLDNVRFHHAKRLKPVLERYRHLIELIFLPPYSPDLNAMERIWWFMRKRVTHNRFVQTMDERIEAFWRFMADFEEPNERGRNLVNISSFD